MSRFARITHIQTGAEREGGDVGRSHNEELHTRQQQTAARVQETTDQINTIRAQQDAAYEHYLATGRYPS